MSKELTYPKALALLSSGRRDATEARLAEWIATTAVGRYVEENLRQKEHSLPPRHMKPLLREFWMDSLSDFDARQLEYEQRCISKVLQGGRARVTPVLLGRARERASFKNHLLRTHYSFFHTEDNVDDFIDRLIDSDPADELTPDEQLLTMTPFAAWATWDESDSAADPFSFAQSAKNGERRETIRVSLGLDAEGRYERVPILTFVYEFHTALRLFRPTIADAGLFVFFCSSAVASRSPRLPLLRDRRPIRVSSCG